MIDILIIIIELMLLATVSLTIWSIIRSQQKVTKPFIWTFAATFVLMLVLLLISRSFVEMFVDTSLVMILVTTVIVLYAYQTKRTKRS